MTILQSRPVVPHTQTTCPSCSTNVEYATPAVASGVPVQVQCFKCNTLFVNHVTQQQPPPRKTRGRKIGTDEKPLETGYYDILNVPVNATSDEIKKAYRRLAIKLHPDKNRDDPNADERFKEIAIAYQILSDPKLRTKYNQFGPKESAPEGGYVDPEEIFGTIFGGDKFIPIFGHISLAKDMKTALQEDDIEEPEVAPNGQKRILSPEEKAKKLQKEQTVLAQKAKEREERVADLVKTLERKLSIFSESATSLNDADVRRSWQQICQIEAEELRNESFGVELLHAIGFVYSSKAKHFLATQSSLFGVGGWLHGVQNRYHVFSETVSTVRAALEVKAVFEQLAQAEKGGVTPEQRKKLEEQAAEKGMQALFKGAKLEIESVLRETCDRVLNPESGVSQDKLVLRATALEILGEAFIAAQKDAPSILDSDYVRIETQSSKARNSGSYSR